ncbi:M48 family metallopeptidase [Sphingomonas alba]|uniref:M48 family metallopeptidase n=1 Tax=Sphingomonas alba TaxID=2908208 RepID=A0ABT0RLS0_9SPHN|nr:M48 family metallopeptidase [Sphingomonas alba]MCL6683596.1 M48 family metallopeptidase [Sphingomonas alba]
MSLMLAAASAAQGFDVEAATRAYLDTLQGAARAKSDAYFEGGYWLPLWGALVGIISYWIMLRFRWSAKWSGWADRVTKRKWLQPMLYALPFTLIGALLTLPWSLYTDYFREHQYGMSNQNLAEWFKEFGIMLGVGIVTTAIFLAIIYAVIRKSPKRWWLWGTVATAVLSAIMILVAPVFIEPLLNKYTPMQAGPVRDEILRIAHEQKIPTNDVYVVDASKQTKRISANVAGIGPTIRIALNDNLLNRSNLAGIKAVMGHEMGHYKLHHIQKLLAYLTILSLIGFLITYWVVPKLLARHGEQWGVREVSDPGSAPVFMIVLAILGVPGGILFNSVIRHHESEADAFGLEAAREPDGFAMTAMQLSEYRKIEPAAWEELLFYDHPSGRTRVHMAMEWKAKHLDELPPEQRKIMVMTPEMKAN